MYEVKSNVDVCEISINSNRPLLLRFYEVCLTFASKSEIANSDMFDCWKLPLKIAVHIPDHSSIFFYHRCESEIQCPTGKGYCEKSLINIQCGADAGNMEMLIRYLLCNRLRKFTENRRESVMAI